MRRHDLRRTFEHRCAQPRWRRRYTCPVCHRIWTPEGSSGWFSKNGQDAGEVIGVVMRYPDGTTATFGHEPEADDIAQLGISNA